MYLSLIARASLSATRVLSSSSPKVPTTSSASYGCGCLITSLKYSCSYPVTLTNITCNNDIQKRYRSNRSRRGLYDGKDVRTGNSVSFSMRNTKRKFKPNVFIKRVYSEILDNMIPFHLTASTLRSIDKAGGLDNYLLSNDDITEGEGFKVKKTILKRLKNQASMARKSTDYNIPNDAGIIPESGQMEKVEVQV